MIMESDLITLLTTLAAAIMAIYEWYKAQQANKTTAATHAFYDDDSPVVAIPQGTPTRNYKISDAVKGFILHGHSIEDQASIVDQITAAEAKMDETGKYFEYTIRWSKGWYLIAWGQIKTSGGE
jgi:hypothetical protein